MIFLENLFEEVGENVRIKHVVDIDCCSGIKLGQQLFDLRETARHSAVSGKHVDGGSKVSVGSLLEYILDDAASEESTDNILDNCQSTGVGLSQRYVGIDCIHPAARFLVR